MVGRWLVVVAWLYIVVLMAAAEATSPNGSVLGALVTLLLYGVGPLALLMYLLGTPARRRRRRTSATPDGRNHPAGDAIAPEREEP
jgi:hypothetical protein